MKYILALDQGTTSSRAILFDEHQNVIASAQKEFKQIFPRSGWVEHDPMDIYSSQYAVMLEAVSKSGVDPRSIAAIGIANQRETTIVWDKNTGLPVYNAIVWQCRRTAEICKDLEKRGLSDYIKKTTGLLPDAYFSGPKVKWILDNVAGARERAERGELLMGTVDTWLIWKLTGGVIHATDYTNASRTMLFDINRLCWDDTLLRELDIPKCMLPEVRPCSGKFGYVDVLGAKIPISGVAGDQQAALMGQTCTEPGETKNTYGTGCFLLMNTGDKPVISENGLVTTIASYMDGKATYALEGSIFVGGAVIQWLRDEMKFLSESPEAETLAKKVPDTGGVYFVPAFTGLGAPHWDMYARGCIIGITRATSREHIVRAAQESIAYQVSDLVSVMERETGISLPSLRVDGGAARDSFLLQFQSDIMDKQIERPVVTETTALGAAFFAGLSTGVWHDVSEIRATWQCSAEFSPKMDDKQREKLLHGWHKAVGRSLEWTEE